MLPPRNHFEANCIGFCAFAFSRTFLLPVPHASCLDQEDKKLFSKVYWASNSRGLPASQGIALSCNFHTIVGHHTVWTSPFYGIKLRAAVRKEKIYVARDVRPYVGHPMMHDGRLL